MTEQVKATAPENPFCPVTVIVEVLAVVCPGDVMVRFAAASVKLGGGPAGAVTVKLVALDVAAL